MFGRERGVEEERVGDNTTVVISLILLPIEEEVCDEVQEASANVVSLVCRGLQGFDVERRGWCGIAMDVEETSSPSMSVCEEVIV